MLRDAIDMCFLSCGRLTANRKFIPLFFAVQNIIADLARGQSQECLVRTPVLRGLFKPRIGLDWGDFDPVLAHAQVRAEPPALLAESGSA
jgi:hypothetical protein